jgi:glyoxylase-like metal-dependent hydrolase (beta-lactamase superfamily II)
VSWKGRWPAAGFQAVLLGFAVNAFVYEAHDVKHHTPSSPFPASVVSWLGAAVLLASTAVFSHDEQGGAITSTPLDQGLYLLQGKGGNLALSTGDDGAFLIDDDYRELSGELQATLDELTSTPLRFVVNTHWHFDHTGGNEALGADGATIVAHENVRKRLSSDQFMKAFDKTIPATDAVGLPVVTFTEGVTLHLNGHTIQVKHLPPAHTDGDAFVYFKEVDVLHTGDIFFNGFYPFIDSGSGGHIAGMIAAADRLLALATDDTRIIPGHGPLGKRADLQAYRDMLATVHERLRKMLEAGKTRAQIIAAKPTADLDETWGDGFLKPDQWVGIVVDGMQANDY